MFKFSLHGVQWLFCMLIMKFVFKLVFAAIMLFDCV